MRARIVFSIVVGCALIPPIHGAVVSADGKAAIYCPTSADELEAAGVQLQDGWSADDQCAAIGARYREVAEAAPATFQTYEGSLRDCIPSCFRGQGLPEFRPKPVKTCGSVVAYVVRQAKAGRKWAKGYQAAGVSGDARQTECTVPSAGGKWAKVLAAVKGQLDAPASGDVLFIDPDEDWSLEYDEDDQIASRTLPVTLFSKTMEMVPTCPGKDVDRSLACYHSGSIVAGHAEEAQFRIKNARRLDKLGDVMGCRIEAWGALWRVSGIYSEYALSPPPAERRYQISGQKAALDTKAFAAFAARLERDARDLFTGCGGDDAKLDLPALEQRP